MQRMLNGLHLLALLGGIYLMIFVVEPVAVPHQYLAQHYYGLPWSADRRNGQHKESLRNLPFLKRKNFLSDSFEVNKRAQWIYNDTLKNSQPGLNFQYYGMPAQTVKESKHSGKNISTSLTGNSRVRYVSSPNVQSNSTPRGRVQAWSKWIPPRNFTDKWHPKRSEPLQWSPSRKGILRSNPEDEADKKIFNSSGSATSIRLTEIWR